MKPAEGEEPRARVESPKPTVDDAFELQCPERRHLCEYSTDARSATCWCEVPEVAEREAMVYVEVGWRHAAVGAGGDLNAVDLQVGFLATPEGGGRGFAWGLGLGGWVGGTNGADVDQHRPPERALSIRADAGGRIAVSEEVHVDVLGTATASLAASGAGEGSALMLFGAGARAAFGGPVRFTVALDLGGGPSWWSGPVSGAFSTSLRVGGSF